MTAHREKPTLTPDRIAWFARYYRRNPSWGIFHVALADGNYNFGSARESRSTLWTTSESEAAAWFDALTPSQRRRLGQRAESLASTVDWKGGAT